MNKNYANTDDDARKVLMVSLINHFNTILENEGHILDDMENNNFINTGETAGIKDNAAIQQLFSQLQLEINKPEAEKYIKEITERVSMLNNEPGINSLSPVKRIKVILEKIAEQDTIQLAKKEQERTERLNNAVGKAIADALNKNGIK